MKPMTFFIGERQKKRLGEMAQEKDINFSEMLRRVIDDYIDRKKDKKKAE